MSVLCGSALLILTLFYIRIENTLRNGLISNSRSTNSTQGEVLPPGYSVLLQTIGGHRANLDSKGFLDRGSDGAFVCFTRRGPQDHGPAIADIAVLRKGGRVRRVPTAPETHGQVLRY